MKQRDKESEKYRLRERKCMHMNICVIKNAQKGRKLNTVYP